MADELKDILNNSNGNIDNQKLMDYLSKKLPAQESHELEKQMADDDFMNDAVEGLEQMGSTQKLSISVETLNRELQKQVSKNKQRKQKRKLKEQPWLYMVIVLLLLLVVLCYIVVKKYYGTPKPQTGKSSATAIYSMLKQNHTAHL